MNKNTIIRVDANNIIYLQLDTETHEGYGGILDPESGVWYEISTVVSPTKSTIVRFDDTNVVLIKLDPDTHDSSAIIMDEVSGQVYPIGEPTGNYVKVGDPVITSEGFLQPSEGNFIKTPENFNPGTSPWEIVVKYRYHTAANNVDILGSLDADDAPAYGVLLKCKTNKAAYGLLSSNGTSWDIENELGYTYAPATTANTWIWTKIYFTGAGYQIWESNDGEEYARRGFITTSTPIKQGLPIGIGLKNTNVLQGDIDLNECYIKIGDDIWWTPLGE